MSKDLTPAELFAIQAAGARQQRERSHALPQQRYRDPAETVEFPAEIARRKKKQSKKRKGKK